MRGCAAPMPNSRYVHSFTLQMDLMPFLPCRPICQTLKNRISEICGQVSLLDLLPLVVLKFGQRRQAHLEFVSACTGLRACVSKARIRRIRGAYFAKFSIKRWHNSSSRRPVCRTFKNQVSEFLGYVEVRLVCWHRVLTIFLTGHSRELH